MAVRVVPSQSMSVRVMSVTYRPRRIFACAVLVEDDCVVGGVLVRSSYCTICTRACLHVWTRGWLVGWLWCEGDACLAASAWGGCLWVAGWGGGVFGVLWVRGRVGVSLVGVWVVSCERVCLCEVCGWVGDVEGVAFLEELFGF